MVQSCATCGASLDVSSFAPGTAFACGGCGAALTAGRTPGAPGTRPPRPPTSAGARAPAPPPVPPPMPALAQRNAPSSDTEEKRIARARLKAAQACSTSLYATIAMVPLFLIFGFLGVAVLAVISFVFGAKGLSTLKRLGVGGRREDAAGGMVRAASRVAKKAPAKAWAGMGLSAAGLLLSGLLLYNALQERERLREASERFGLELREHLRHLQETQDRLRRDRPSVPVEDPAPEEDPAEDRDR